MYAPGLFPRAEIGNDSGSRMRSETHRFSTRSLVTSRTFLVPRLPRARVQKHHRTTHVVYIIFRNHYIVFRHDVAVTTTIVTSRFVGHAAAMEQFFFGRIVFTPSLHAIIKISRPKCRKAPTVFEQSTDLLAATCETSFSLRFLSLKRI